MSASRRRLAFTPLGLALGLAAACVHDRGEIELNWTIVDRGGTQVFPFGFLGDTCEFRGKFAEAEAPRDYDLQVQLRLCDPDCADGCDAPACQVDVLRFDCSAARGFSTVPVSGDSPYDMRVDLVAAPDDGTCGCSLTPPCALVPGPRRRSVEPGLVTDLQVYLLVLGLDDIAASYQDGRARLDLDACCTPDPTCAAP